MPNIKSAIKRVGVIEKKTARNNMIKSGLLYKFPTGTKKNLSIFNCFNVV